MKDPKTVKESFKVQRVGVTQRVPSKTKKCTAAKSFLLYHKSHGAPWAWGEASWFPSRWWLPTAGDTYVTSAVIWILFLQSILKIFQVAFYSTFPILFHWTPLRLHWNKWRNSSTLPWEALRITACLCSIGKSYISEHQNSYFYPKLGTRESRHF